VGFVVEITVNINCGEVGGQISPWMDGIRHQNSVTFKMV
jgi:hypothetical protein